MSVTNSPGAIINWQGFSIGSGETTRFIQQSATSSVLNRVIGPDPSVILGTLSSNGRVFLINPSGILVGPGARLDVAGLVASTLNLSNQDFLAGRLNFAANPLAGKLENQGSITTPSGGNVYLVGANVTNSGIINSPQGDVILAAGQSVKIFDSSTPGLRVEITASDNSAVNLGKILAQSGEVGIYGAALRNAGIIDADQVVRDASGRIVLRAKQDVTLAAGSRLSANGEQAGVITVQSESGTTLVSGVIEARSVSALAGQGGKVQLLGQRVGLIAASVDASGTTGGGSVLIGGDYQGKNPSVQNAATTYVSPDASVKADAIASGNGGKVIVWSDGSTRAYGSFTARGGAQAGDGGLIETSGHFLDVADIGINAGAVRGKPGTWLLDPWNVTITTAAVASGAWRVPFAATTIWDTTASGSNVTNTTISGYLNAGTNVSITTTPFPADAGTEPGNITLSAPILHDSNSAGSPNVTLSLTAGTTGSSQGNIVINDSIRATTGSNVLNVVLNSAGGSVGFGASGSISTNGGNVTISAGTTASLGNITAGAGVVSAIAGGALTLAGTISSDAPGNAVVLAGSSFTNATGAAAIANSVGRWLVYSANPAADSFASLSSGNLALWGKTYAGYPPAGVSESGNRYLFANQPGLTVTANASTKIYGDGVVLTAAITGLVNAASYGGVFTQDAYSGTPSLTSPGTAPSAGVSGSPYTITAASGTFAEPGGYAATAYAGALLTISKAHLTVTADNQSRLYGDANPALTATLSGFKNGEILSTSGVTGSATVATAATASTAVGTAAITNAVGTLSATNYDFTTFTPGTLTISKAHLTVTADNQSRLYGDANPALTATLSGFKNGEILSSSGVTGSATVATAATASTAVGTAAITNAVGTLSATNYDFTTFAPGTLTISKAHLTATADNQSRLYGDANPALTATLSGFKNGEILSSSGVTGSAAVATAATASTAVGTAAITDSVGTLAASNYDFTTFTPGTLTITRAPLTVTATVTSKTYDGLAYSGGNGVAYSGFVNSESAAVLGGTLAYGGTAQGAINAGSYLITPSGLTSGNYTISFVDGTLSIIPAGLHAISLNGTRPYDGTLNLAASIFTLSGLVSGENLTLTGIGTVANPNVGANKPVTLGSLTLGNGTNGLASNYTFIGGTQTASITQVPLSVTANNAVKTYNGLAYSGGNGVAYSGFVNSESAAVLGGTLAYGGTAQGAINAGSYLITPSGLSSGNYTISYVSGTLGVTAAPLGIAANSATRLYGEANPAFSATYSGFQNGENATALSGALALATPAIATSSVGNYAIIPSGQSATNYTITYVNGNLGVARSPLSITVSSTSKTYGSTVSFSGSEFSSSGLKNGETVGSVSLASAGAASTAGVAGSPYDITASTASGGSFNPGNYTISYVNGVLGVIRAPLGIAANSTSKTFGDTLSFSGNEFSSSGLKNGETVGSVSLASAGATSTAGVAGSPYDITASAASGGSFNPGNYTISYVNGTLGVIPAELNVSALGIAANAASKTYDGLPYRGGNGVTYSGFQGGDSAASLNGTLVYGGSSQGAVNVGSYVIIPSGQSSPNYTIVYVNGKLSVTPAPLGIAANSATRLYGNANPAFSATYTGFQNGETTAALTGTLAFATPASATSNVGNYTIIPSGQSSTNYTITYINSKLSVTPAPLGIAANSTSKTYGNTVSFSGSEFSSAGLRNGETIGSVSLASAGAGSAAAVADSPYSITISAASGGSFQAGNYTIQYVDGNLGVLPSPLGIAANSASKAYGSTLNFNGSEFSSTGLRNGETVGSVSLASAGAAATAGVAGSPYGITVNAASGGSFNPGNYTISYINGALGVVPVRLLGITANAATKTYDGLAYSGGNGVSYSGFQGTDSVASLNGTLAYGGSSQGAVNVGSYAIIPAGQSSPNYTIVYVDGKLSVTPASLLVTADAKSKLFGASDPALTFSVAGLVNNPSAGIVDTAGSVLTGALTRVPGESALGGPYAITQGSLAAGSNYTLGFTGNQLIIVGAAAEPVLGFNAPQVVFNGVINNEFYYRPGNFWHISLNPDNADPGFDVMRGTSDSKSRLSRSANSCDSVAGGGFCETWSFPQQFGKGEKK